MSEARRTLRCWLLMAFLERGAGPPVRRRQAPPARVRPMSREELRRLCGPLAPIRVLRPAVDPSGDSPPRDSHSGTELAGDVLPRDRLSAIVLPFPGGA